MFPIRSLFLGFFILKSRIEITFASSYLLHISFLQLSFTSTLLFVRLLDMKQIILSTLESIYS